MLFFKAKAGVHTKSGFKERREALEEGKFKEKKKEEENKLKETEVKDEGNKS